MLLPRRRLPSNAMATSQPAAPTPHPARPRPPPPRPPPPRPRPPPPPRRRRRRRRGGAQLTEAAGGADAARLFDDYVALNKRRNGEVLDFMSKHIAVANAQRAFKASEVRYEAAAEAYNAAYGGATDSEGEDEDRGAVEIGRASCRERV